MTALGATRRQSWPCPLCRQKRTPIQRFIGFAISYRGLMVLLKT